MSIIIDLIFVAVIVICTLASAKKGFVKVLVETVGFIAALYLAFTISSPLADVTYDKIIEPPIIEAVNENISDNVSITAENIINALPEFVSGSLQKYTDEIQAQLSENTLNGATSPVVNASQTVIKPVVTKLLSIIYFIICTVILLIIVKLLAKIINKLFSFSIVGTANRVLGAILGLIKGVALAFVLAAVISLCMGIAPNGFLIFTTTSLSKSLIFNLFTQLNPLLI